jgi:hypothetical protein
MNEAKPFLISKKEVWEASGTTLPMPHCALPQNAPDTCAFS